MKIRFTAYAIALWLAFGNAATAFAQLPAGWTDIDISGTACSPAGSATYTSTNGAFTVNGGGRILSGTSDKLNFCYQTYTGDFTLIARNTSNDGYSGIMVRESLAPEAREQFVCTFPFTSGSMSPVWAKARLTVSGSAIINSGPTLVYPYLMIQRAGDCFYSFCSSGTSSDTVDWLPLPKQYMPGLASTVYVGLSVSSSGTGALATAVFDDVSIQPLSSGSTVPGTVSQSWIGNTFANGDAYKEMQNTVTGMYVDPDGTCYTNTLGQELARAWGVYKSGTTVGYLPGFVGYGGAAITSASNCPYLYLAQEVVISATTGTNYYYGVSRFNKSTLTPAPFQGSLSISNSNMMSFGLKPGNNTLNCPGNVWGLACNSTANTVYASDTINGQIRLIDMTTMSTTGTWTLTSGYQPYGLCWDPTDSLLWVIVENTADHTREIWAYNSSGVKQDAFTITMAANAKPVSMALYINRLYIADNGPDQNVKVYMLNKLYTAPYYAPYFWITYGSGSFSANPHGAVGTWLLNGLNCVGVDGSNNIYVACNGRGPDLNEDGKFHNYGYGGTLECYNDRTLSWRMQGLQWFDVVNIDPGDETSAYGNATHYSMNWANTAPGSEWAAVGNTLNFWKYPNDFRYYWATNTNFPTMQMIRIQGQKFLTINSTFDLNIYRFDTSSDGEVAIPCADFNTRSGTSGIRTGTYGLSIWADTSLNGLEETVERSYFGNFDLSSVNGSYIDSDGTLWVVSGTTIVIRQYPCTLVPSWAPKVPHYTCPPLTSTTLANLPATPAPYNDHIQYFSGSGECNRLVYDASTQTMYVLGFSKTFPNISPFKDHGAGTVVICYKNWGTTKDFAWECPLPVTLTGSVQTTFAVEAMAGAGKYLFVQFLQGEQTLVISKETGDIIGSIFPDRAILGSLGWVDFSHGISAFQRANGEYIITLEDDVYGKTVMYRWTGAP